MNNKGQFFSPDLIIAMVIFVIILAFFFITSNTAAIQIDYYYSVSSLDEISHKTMDSLVFFPGEPFNWNTKTLTDTNFFGLVDSVNVINPQKLDKLVYYLNNDYSTIKTKLGLSKYDFELSVIDFNGSIITSGGTVNDSYTTKLAQSRIVSYNNRQVLLKGVFSYED